MLQNQPDVRLSGVVTGDRVPSRQNLTRGSRRRTRGSAIENESNIPPGVMTNPNEFNGPTAAQSHIHYFDHKSQTHQFHPQQAQQNHNS